MSMFLEKAGKNIFQKHLEQYTPQDPFYEFYVDDRGKQKRRKRVLPPGLSSRDAKILKSVQRRAHYLDKGFRVFSLRFGWTFVIGLIPVIGDFADLTLNYLLVVRKARQADIPPWLLSRMLVNNAISASVGFVPVVGDVILAMYKANSRNAALLEEFLRIRGEEFLKMQEQESQNMALGDTRRTKGMSKKDIEQVKPGAGVVRGEASNMKSNQKNETIGKASGSERGKVFGLFGSGKSSTKSDGNTPSKGRFVEDIGQTE